MMRRAPRPRLGNIAHAGIIHAASGRLSWGWQRHGVDGQEPDLIHRRRVSTHLKIFRSVSPGVRDNNNHAVTSLLPRSSYGVWDGPYYVEKQPCPDLAGLAGLAERPDARRFKPTVDILGPGVVCVQP